MNVIVMPHQFPCKICECVAFVASRITSALSRYGKEPFSCDFITFFVIKFLKVGVFMVVVR